MKGNFQTKKKGFQGKKKNSIGISEYIWAQVP